MTKKEKKAFFFDINTKKLELTYPKKDWRQGYKDIENFLTKEGFEHIQGSVYKSYEKMSYIKAMDIITALSEEYPWLNESMRNCSIGDAPDMYDVTYIFTKLERESDKKKHVGMEQKNKRKIKSINNEEEI